MTMNPSVWVFDTIKKYEGLRVKPYRCPAGVWTVGYGYTRRVDPTKVITTDRAEELLEEDVLSASGVVRALVKTDLNQEQFDALIDFVFNLGEGNFAASTLLRYVNNGDFSKAADEFLKWNHCNGEILAGLTKRREAERQRFMEE